MVDNRIQTSVAHLNVVGMAPYKKIPAGSLVRIDWSIESISNDISIVDYLNYLVCGLSIAYFIGLSAR